MAYSRDVDTCICWRYCYVFWLTAIVKVMRRMLYLVSDNTDKKSPRCRGTTLDNFREISIWIEDVEDILWNNSSSILLKRLRMRIKFILTHSLCIIINHPWPDPDYKHDWLLAFKRIFNPIKSYWKNTPFLIGWKGVYPAYLKIPTFTIYING